MIQCWVMAFIYIIPRITERISRSLNEGLPTKWLNKILRDYDFFSR